MNKNQIINTLTYAGERTATVIVNKVEKDCKEYAINDIDDIIRCLNILKEEINKL